MSMETVLTSMTVLMLKIAMITQDVLKQMVIISVSVRRATSKPMVSHLMALRRMYH